MFAFMANTDLVCVLITMLLLVSGGEKFHWGITKECLGRAASWGGKWPRIWASGEAASLFVLSPNIVSISLSIVSPNTVPISLVNKVQGRGEGVGL